MLTKGARLGVAAILLLYPILALVSLVPFQLASYLSPFLGFPVAVGLGLVLAAYTAVALSLFYLPLRVRREGYDLELLARAVAAPSEPSAASPGTGAR